MKLAFGRQYVTQPMPVVVETALKSIRRVLATIGGATYIAGYPHIIFYVMVLQAILEEAANFIGVVTKPGDMEKITLEGPKEATDQLTLKTEIIPEKEE